MKYSFTIFLIVFYATVNGQFNSFDRYNYYKAGSNIHDMNILEIEITKNDVPNIELINMDRDDFLAVHKEMREITTALPLKNISVTSKYGIRFHPVYSRELFHNGVDLAVNYDTIYASFSGSIGAVSFDERSGIYIKLISGNLNAGYAHLSKSFVLPGAFVFCGQAIGITGSTGAATGPHLHFSLKYKDKWIDPLPFLYLTVQLGDNSFNF